MDPFSPEAIQFYKKVEDQRRANPLTAPTTIPAPADLQFANQRQATEDAFSQQSANNAYGRATTASEYLRKLRDFNFQQDRMRAKMPYMFNRRGMAASGVWRQGLQEYAQTRMRGAGDLQEAQARSLGQYDINEQMLLKQKLLALAQVEAQRQAMIAQLSQKGFGA